MVNPLRFFSRREYFFRPGQAWRRVRRGLHGPPPEVAEVELPWGARLRIHPHETIGSVIWYYGVFDLIVAEAITRLLDAGELALDVGANIGQMTSLMRRLAGPHGRVLAFEPHPQLSAALQDDLQRGGPEDAPVQLYPIALSAAAGRAFLTQPAGWQANCGLAHVSGTPLPAAENHPVELARLDELLAEMPHVGVCKVDVEGHEPAVFAGARGLLERRAIRDVVFEELHGLPSESSDLLTAAGYEIFALQEGFWGPVLADATTAGHAGNYLATCDPVRARQRFAPRGWQALKRPRRSS